MKLTFFAALLWGIVFVCTSTAAPPGKKPADAGSKDVSAAQVNGTWKSRMNTFKIWALGNGKLQIDFYGTFAYKTSMGPMANTGEGAGIAIIEGDTAIFRPEGADPECKITLKFTGGKLIVKQEGECDFGHSVYADGTYKKSSSKKPSFEQ